VIKGGSYYEVEQHVVDLWGDPITGKCFFTFCTCGWDSEWETDRKEAWRQAFEHRVRHRKGISTRMGLVS
jgi:hypothetical protein